MVLLSRKIAERRAVARAIGTGQLHTRLVALFSVIAAVPTVIVAIFASLLLQSGLEFWFPTARGECWKIPSSWRNRPTQRGQPGRRRGGDDGRRPSQDLGRDR
jgi:ABC-type phosphate transport system permease subunit